jgi:hypothetical protein
VFSQRVSPQSNGIDTKTSTSRHFFSLLGVTALIAAGFTQPTLTFTAGLVITLGVVALAMINKSHLSSLLIFIAVLTSFQLLQNSRTNLGLYFLSPYSWAFAPNPIEEKITTAIKVQQWLLQNTTNQDQILTWVDGSWTQGDRELYAVAAMQLWGENRLTLEPVVDEYATEILGRTSPTVIALYGPTQIGINTMHASIPGSGPLTCIEFDWPMASNTNFPLDPGLACLARLSLP